ncbi:restriction endonuclease subunit S [Luminiphilus sp.]|nr:restriction endonuclease subunit S [Luminiphilus sp.]
MSSAVPEGWQVSQLGSLATVNWGNTSLTKDSYAKTGFPAYSAAGNDGLVPNAEHNDVGVVLSAIGARCGRTFLTPKRWTAIKNTITILSDNQDIRFLYQVFNFNEVWNKSGGAQPFISLGDARKTPILTPPLPEQRKIASILTSVDEVIENTHRQIDKLQDLKKATMNELLTRGIGHTEFKDSELGRIPKSWEVKTIRELIEKVVDNRGKTPPLSESGRELIEIASISKDNRFLNYKLSKKKVSENTYHTWFRNGHPKVGDVLVPTVGLIGQCSIVREERGCIAQNLIGLRSSERLLGEYLYWVMNSQYVLEEIQRVLMGAVQPSLKVPHLLDASVPLPPLREQQNITKILNSIEDNIIEVQEKGLKNQSLKKSLMQDLLTGKVRVSLN